MKNYIEFRKQFEIFKFTKEIGITTSLGTENSNAFVENIECILNNCKIFNVDEQMKKLLIMTHIPKFNSHLKLPFPELFIDVEFDDNDLKLFQKEDITVRWDKNEMVKLKKIVGICVTRGNLRGSKNVDIVGDAARVSINEFGHNIQKEDNIDNRYMWFDTFNFDIDIMNEKYNKFSIKQMSHNPKVKKFITNFTIAFLNLLNNPE